MSEHVTREFCQLQHKSVNDKLDEVLKVLRGNGRPGLPMLVDRHDRILRVLTWFTATATGAVIVCLIGLLLERR